MTTGTIFDIKRYAIHDGPGIRTTVFLKGCPLQCWWCHNPEGLIDSAQRFYNADRCVGCGACVDQCPGRALTRSDTGIRCDPNLCRQCFTCSQVCPSEATRKIGRVVTVTELLEIVDQDRLFYDQSGGGVTFSGGEPLSQADFLLEALTACGRMGIHRVVDTSGYGDPEQLLAVAEQTDLFLFDLKLMDAEKHRKYTGLPNHKILENLRLIAASGADINVRIPVIPGINTDGDNLKKTAAFIAAQPGLQRIELLSYHSTARKKYRQLGMDFIPADICAPTENDINKLTATLEALGMQVSSGGSQ
jgi:pyruvate formate lyase activating enzyme